MTKEEIQALSPYALFRHVFGMKLGETLSEFMRECKPVREDDKFVAAVREFALREAS